MLYDIAIIGMGPAGALAGILLAREGFTVVGIGPSSIPESGDQRAETLSPSAIAILSQHGLRSALEALAFPAVPGFLANWADAKDRFRPTLLTPDAPTLSIARGSFDYMLQTGAEREGVVHVAARARQLQSISNGWKILLNEGASMFARVVIDASGRGGRFLRQLGSKLLVLDRLVSVTDVSSTRSTNFGRTVRIIPDSEGWSFETVDVVGRDVRARYTDIDLYKKGIKDGHCTRLWAASSLVLERAVCGAAIAVGDAAQTRDPLSSHGICSALADSQSAALALTAWIKGDSQAIGAHEIQRRRREIDYLRQMNRFYRAEDRWAGSVFWQRRQSLDRLRILASLWA